MTEPEPGVVHEHLKKAEAALRESEERYRLLFEGSRDAIAVYGRGIRPLFFNQQFIDMAGYTAEEIAELDPLDLVHPDDRELIQRNNQARLAGVPVPRIYEFRMLKKDGREAFVEASFDPIHSGVEIIGIQGVFRDITERKKAEEVLRTSEERYRLLFDLSNEGIGVFDKDLQPILLNDRFTKLVGYSREELLRMDISQLIDPLDRDRVMEIHKRRIQGEAVSRVYEFRALHKNGTVLEIEGSFDLIHRGTEIIGVQGLFRDISERKRIQEVLLERQKEQSITTLAGGIAHDFNNILLGVMGNAALLLDDLGEHSNARVLANNILTSAGRMADLTSQLLAYARGGRHRPEPSDLNQLVHEALQMIHGALLPSIRVECRLASDLLPVECDPTQVCQVLLNLLVNACEAMEGGGTLTVKTENVVFASEWFGSAGESVPAGEYVHIVLSDTGAGMPDDIRRRIFEPFFTTKFMGRGLGLAAALGIMRNHQGGVLVESQPGQGTIFHLHFPRTHSILEPATPVVEQPLQYTGTVLVVDDEEVVREVALRMLQKMGFEVLLAESGRQALEIFEASSGRIRLVILDIQMAGMGGAEVFARMREINANVQVVVSSGYDEAAMAEFPSSECLAGFIKKPYTLAALREAVDEAIQAS